MIFKPKLAHLIIAGKKTQTRRPVKLGETECRYKPGRSYTVQPGRTKPGIARIDILTVERQKLGDLTYQDARAEGFRTRDDFYDYWRELYHQEPDLEQDVWAITFCHDPALRPRFLHRSSDWAPDARTPPGYTHDPRLALEQVEVVDEYTLNRYAEANRERHDTFRRDHAATIAQRLQRAEELAERRGINIAGGLRQVQRQVAAIERRLDRRVDDAA